MNRKTERSPRVLENEPQQKMSRNSQVRCQKLQTWTSQLSNDWKNPWDQSLARFHTLITLFFLFRLACLTLSSPLCAQNELHNVLQQHQPWWARITRAFEIFDERQPCHMHRPSWLKNIWDVLPSEKLWKVENTWVGRLQNANAINATLQMLFDFST